MVGGWIENQDVIYRKVKFLSLCRMANTLSCTEERIGSVGDSHLGNEALYIIFQFMKDGGIGMTAAGGRGRASVSDSFSWRRASPLKSLLPI